MTVKLLRVSVDVSAQIKSRPGKTWLILTGLATLLGIVSLRYALPGAPFHPAMRNFVVSHRALIVHALSASMALLLGPWQFLPGLRSQHPAVHRWIGRGYATSLFTAATSAFVLCPHATGGVVSTAGFSSLALGWLVTTSLGVIAIRRHNIPSHRRWMTRSFALTAAAITLRLYLLAIPLFHLEFKSAYAAISWLCWISNLCIAELWLTYRKAAQSKRIDSPPIRQAPMRQMSQH
jgi:uncharacterized membrane protein